MPNSITKIEIQNIVEFIFPKPYTLLYFKSEDHLMAMYCIKVSHSNPIL